MAFDYDLFVIGGGSGGVRAARMAAATGAKVALAEESRLGGTCVIRGCVPKKLMVYASSFREMPAEARAYGWDIADGAFNWLAFRAKLHAELARLEGIYRRLLDGSGVEVMDARAALADPHTVTLSDGRRVSAKHILIATGGKPDRPSLPNAELGLVSDDVFNLEALPETILIIGSGFIACEMACIMAGLGVKVTQYCRGTQILRGFDDEAREVVANAMRAKGVELLLGTEIGTLSEAATQGPAGAPRRVAVTCSTGQTREYDALLFATGRKPNSQNLGLEDLGLTLGKEQEILVDRYSQTALPSVYAIGDVTNRINLTPVAIREGMAFVRTVFDGIATEVDHDLVPAAVFTQPELGAIGLTEAQAAVQEPIEVYTTSFKPMRSAFAGADERVFMKLIVAQASRKVLGCHIVAPEAGEMIQLAAIAVKMGATKEDFDRTVAVHPTMAEELVTMRTPTRRT